MSRFSLSSTSTNAVFSSDESLISITSGSGSMTIANGSGRSCSVSISDEKGHPLRRCAVRAGDNCAVGNLPAGVYIVRLQNAAVDDARKVTVSK